MSRFTFGEVEAVLAELNNIASDKRVAFSSRLKNLQKQGLKSRSGSPGKGKVARLSFVELIELAVGVELLRLGLPPQRAASIVSKSSDAFRYVSYLATFGEDEAREKAEANGVDLPELRYIWLVRFDALAEMTKFGWSEYDDYEAIEAVPFSQVESIFDVGADGGADKIDGVPRRHLAINGTALCRSAVHIAAYSLLLATPEDMRADVVAEFDRIRDLLEKLDKGISPEDGDGDT